MLPSIRVACPYCGEPLELRVDVSAGAQRYVEDCAVCCRPVVVQAEADEAGGAHVRVRREDEA
ncbi:CPXCG motif-containing cysteine-rich protein [Vulcaniibacterium tengchongense]|uniref:Cysteine-rich CPXCG protein n=1 Tax=Vulcaniibacterium tengchongense TaxID=1273429 RepID=A0A3N4W3C2_9GAMM|nr:CPXCG motif-containing cysteine-rich protein [Vulcaniibacterium tengchongense]RPE79694.1 cysteine-rich CPXCG protein [Vulcaniibacterium tengchongense]